MIADALGLELEPFRLTPDLRFYCATRPQRAALAELRGALDGGAALVLLEGDVGAGKTILLKRLEADLKRDEARVALVPYPRLKLAELLAWFKPNPGRGRAQILLIDEAGSCTDELLAELRDALAAPGAQRPQVVLCGGPGLGARIAHSALAPLAGAAPRVALAPLADDEIGPYVEHRLRIAGAAAAALFTQEAVAEIARRSRGLPRLVNQICARALLLAQVESNAKVPAAAIADAAGDWPAQDGPAGRRDAAPAPPPAPAPPRAAVAPLPARSEPSPRRRDDPARPKPPQPPPVPRAPPAVLKPRRRLRRAGIAALVALALGVAGGGAVALADPELARLKDALRPYAAAVNPALEQGRDAARRLAAKAERAMARLLDMIDPS